ncbi:MAG: hypothetical protein ACREH5_04200, partial [Candidatus Omnitrophota bacterium]
GPGMPFSAPQNFPHRGKLCSVKMLAYGKNTLSMALAFSTCLERHPGSLPEGLGSFFEGP